MKVSKETLSLWGQLLQRVAQARLILLAPPGSARDFVLTELGRHNIDPERVEFCHQLSRKDYLDAYRRIDIGLDTLPYNGHTTSFDAFWMGVPVVTLVGQTVVGRAGSIWWHWCGPSERLPAP